MSKKKTFCELHPETELVCLKCVQAKGGKTTAERHGDKLGRWGAMGGRPRKMPKR